MVQSSRRPTGRGVGKNGRGWVAGTHRPRKTTPTNSVKKIGTQKMIDPDIRAKIVQWFELHGATSGDVEELLSLVERACDAATSDALDSEREHDD